MRTTLAVCKQYPGLGRAHLEPRRGSKSQAIAYCRKVESRIEGPWEHGALGSTAGRRSDLKTFVDAVISGEVSREEVVVLYPEILAKYPR